MMNSEGWRSSSFVDLCKLTKHGIRQKKKDQMYKYVLDVAVTGNVASQLRFKPAGWNCLSETNKSNRGIVLRWNNQPTQGKQSPAQCLLGAGPRQDCFMPLTMVWSVFVPQPVESRGGSVFGALMHRCSAEMQNITFCFLMTVEVRFGVKMGPIL